MYILGIIIISLLVTGITLFTILAGFIWVIEYTQNAGLKHETETEIRR
jgi:hypothetical protein